MEFFSEVWTLFSAGFSFLSSLSSWGLLLLGTGAGVLMGALPGVSSTMALVVFTPMTFTLDAGPAFLMLMGVYVGSVFGGSISAICINIPGTAGSIGTLMDGYPLTLKGEAGRAVSVATISSTIGSMLGFIVLLLLVQPLAKAVTLFSSFEMCAVAFLGISIVSFISEGPVIHGFISAVVGLLMCTVGLDVVSGVARFTGGSLALMSGFNDIPIMIGVFGVVEILNFFSKNQEVKTVQTLKMDVGPAIKICLSNIGNLIRSSVIGTIIGIIPAAAASMAGVTAYGVAKSTSKNPEKFGTGYYPGLIAAESAKNASVGGALLPMMTLGIPGDPMTAVLIGSLMIHGMVPGGKLFSETPEVVSCILLGVVISGIMLLIFGIMGGNLFSRLLGLPAYYLYPVIVLLCTVGAYVTASSSFDIWVMVLSGIIGFFFIKLRISTLPLVLGLILGSMVEDNLRRTLMLSSRNPYELFQHPLAMLFILIGIVFLVVGSIQQHQNNRREQEAASASDDQA